MSLYMYILYIYNNLESERMDVYAPTQIDFREITFKLLFYVKVDKNLVKTTQNHNLFTLPNN